MISNIFIPTGADQLASVEHQQQFNFFPYRASDQIRTAITNNSDRNYQPSRHAVIS